MPLLCRVIGSVHVVRPASQRASAARGNGQRGLRPARLDAGWRRRRRAGGWPRLWPRDGARDRARRGIQARARAGRQSASKDSSIFRTRGSSAPTGASSGAANRRACRLGRHRSAGMSERLRSPRAQAAIPRVSRSDALSRGGDVDHPFDVRGCSFFVCEGSHEGAVPHLRLAALGREPAFHARVTPCADRRQSSSR